MKWYNLKLIYPNQNHIKDFVLKIPIVMKLRKHWKYKLSMCIYNWITIWTAFLKISLYLILLCQVLELDENVGSVLQTMNITEFLIFWLQINQF